MSVDSSVDFMNCMLIVIACLSCTELLVVLDCMEAVDRLKHAVQKLSTGYSVLCESCRQAEALGVKAVDRIVLCF